MKAVVLDEFGPPEVMRIDDVARPEPAPGEVLVRVVATSVNRPDLIQRTGNYPPPQGESPILGLEIAGTIEALGRGVDAFAPGDRVFGLVGGGAYAEFTVARPEHLLPIPPLLGFEQAACIAETYITAHMNVFGNARLADGESVLLHGGGGGVNTAAIHLVRALRPGTSIFVTASPTKLDRVAALGADVVIDYTTQDFVEIVLHASDRRGADVILDHIGAAYLERNLRTLAVNGRLALIATMGGREATIDLGRVLVRRQTIVGSVLRPRPRAEKAAIIAAFAAEVMPLFESGRIAPVIDRVFPLADVVAAHRAMEAGAHFGKIVLAVAPQQ
jgi:putative PIG3 family NAD(P)H quinone oxidoreductase